MVRFWQSLPPVTRFLATLSAMGFLVTRVLSLAGLPVLHWLFLDASAIQSFQLWRLITYALIPGDPISAFFQTLFLIFLVPDVERAWTHSFFAFFFSICAAASGLVFLWILGNSGVGVLTNSGAMLGIVLAWNQINQFQRFRLSVAGTEVSCTIAAMIWALCILVPVAFGCGWIFTPAVATGAPAAWLVLRLHTAFSNRRSARAANRPRLNHIEL